MSRAMKTSMSDLHRRDDQDWSNGWYLPAQRAHSPNFGTRPPGTVIDLIVVHSISLPPGEYGGCAVHQFFNNELDWSAHPYFRQIEGMQVSTHFFIQRDGVLWQFVDADHRAWHAGASCYRGRSNCNDDSIGIELEGLAGLAFESAQYKALASLCQALMQRYPIQHLAGHEHIAPGRKEDPGSGFDWILLKTQLGLPAHYFPVQAP